MVIAWQKKTIGPVPAEQGEFERDVVSQMYDLLTSVRTEGYDEWQPSPPSSPMCCMISRIRTMC
jgi:hypothetical protein